MCLFETVQQGDVFLVHNNGIYFCKIEDIGDIIWLQSIIMLATVIVGTCGNRPIVYWHNHGPGRDDTIYRFQEGRGVCGQNADPFVAMLHEVIRKSPRAVGKLNVRSPQNLIVGRHVVDSLGLRLNCCGSFQEECWRELVDVMVVNIFRWRCGRR